MHVLLSKDSRNIMHATSHITYAREAGDALQHDAGVTALPLSSLSILRLASFLQVEYKKKNARLSEEVG